MGFLFLAVACSLGVAALFTLAERRDLDRTALLAVNYAAAAALAAVLGGGALWNRLFPGTDRIVRGLIALGVAEGVLYIGGFWLFARAIREAGIGLAAAAMRLSVVLPVLAAWAVWAEAPTAAQGVGLALGGVAFVLLSRPAQPPAEAGVPGRSAAALLGTLFLVGGAVDVGMKAFQERFGVASGVGVSRETFLLIVFGVAFVVGAGLVVAAGLSTGRWPRPAVLAWGAALGVLNYYSAELMLRALAVLRAPVAFPLNNVSVVLGAALIGRIAFGERMSRANVVGLGVAALAVALLAG